MPRAGGAGPGRTVNGCCVGVATVHVAGAGVGHAAPMDGYPPTTTTTMPGHVPNAQWQCNVRVAALGAEMHDGGWRAAGRTNAHTAA